MRGGESLGLNNDPKKVFQFIKDEKGNNILYITGEIYGALTSKQEYENYHLKLQTKWGDKKWEPRLKKLKDSGLLYHCIGPFREFWNVWMSSQELQVQKGEVGDYYALGNAISDVPAKKKAPTNPKNKAMVYALNEAYHEGNTKIAKSEEKKEGKWNTVELITYNGTSLHIVNGKVVMTLYNSRYKKEATPLTRGRIQIQSEGAEVFYRDIQIKSIEGIPNKYKKYLKAK